MKIAVAGKGGSGKTTVSGTLARALARSGSRVVALDADPNPMLGISLGVGVEETDRLLTARQALDAGQLDHQPTAAGLVERFGSDAPDGVRLVVVSRLDNPNPGWTWCGLTPEQLFGELEADGGVVLCDLEAGIGTLLRLEPGQADVALVVVEPSAKSIETGRRAARIAAGRARALVVANKVRDEADLERIRAALGEHELVVVPEDAAIARADREGLASIDVDPAAPGVVALLRLADVLAPSPERTVEATAERSGREK